jgi:hypothetical protein
MSENLTPYTPESTPSLVFAFDQLTSPEGVEAYIQRIAAEAQTFDYQAELDLIDTAQGRLEQNLQDLRGQAGVNEPPYYEQQIKDFSGRLNTLHDRREEAHELHHFQYSRRHNWERFRSMTFRRGETAVSDLADHLERGASLADHDFVYDDIFMSQADTSRPSIIIEARDEPFEFPLTAFVSAAGFDSWEHGRRKLKGDRTSEEVIQDYASRETEIPPVDSARALLLSNGEVILLSDDAHRVSADILYVLSLF